MAALRRGNAIEAVKLLRQSRSIGLREALAHIARNASAVQGTKAAGEFTALSRPVLEALAKGDKTEAIRRVRQETGLGLKEAKAAVESQAIPNPRPGPKLAPGEVPRSGVGTWISVAFVVGATLYLFLR